MPRCCDVHLLQWLTTQTPVFIGKNISFPKSTGSLFYCDWHYLFLTHILIWATHTLQKNNANLFFLGRGTWRPLVNLTLWTSLVWNKKNIKKLHLPHDFKHWHYFFLFIQFKNYFKRLQKMCYKYACQR